MNVQYAIQAGTVYVLEVNPRASRTGAVRQQGDRRSRSPRSPWALMWGRKLKDYGPRLGCAHSPSGFRQIAGLPVQQIPRRGPGARP